MNEIDRKIIIELKKDSRISNTNLAKKIKISEGTIRNRVKKLQDNGTIKRFTVMLGTSTGFLAFVQIKTKAGSDIKKIIEFIRKIDPNQIIYETSGDFDIIMQLECESAEAFNEKIDGIRLMTGVADTNSLVILKVS